MQNTDILRKTYICTADGSTDGVGPCKMKTDDSKFPKYINLGDVPGSEKKKESTYNMAFEAGIFVFSAVDTGGGFFQDLVHSRRNRYAAKTSLRLRRRLDGDEFLRRTYDLSIAEIERILQTRAKNYQIVGYVWKDQETEDWEENVVEVKTEFQDFEEKEDLWDVLGSILENTQQGVAKTYGREIGEDKRPFILHLSKM